ncbi:MAG: redoxin domain-containing protein [Myxococcaceae bacterium]
MDPAKKAPRKRWRRTLLEVAAVGALFFGISAWNSRGNASGPAPSVEGTSLTGQPVSLAGLAGQPVVVHFWATWCGVCTAEKGTIESLGKSHRLITVVEDSGTAEQISAYMKREGLSFPVLVDDGRLSRAYGVSAFPTTFVVGKSGLIRFSEVGYTTWLGLRARLWLAAL